MRRNQSHDKARPLCGAKNRAGEPCKRPAGWGTAHVGEGRCKLHGGNAGAPKGNANARTHALHSGSMDEAERSVYESALELTPEQLASRQAAWIVAKLEGAFRRVPDLELDKVGPLHGAAL